MDEIVRKSVELDYFHEIFEYYNNINVNIGNTEHCRVLLNAINNSITDDENLFYGYDSIINTIILTSQIQHRFNSNIYQIVLTIYNNTLKSLYQLETPVNSYFGLPDFFNIITCVNCEIQFISFWSLINYYAISLRSYAKIDTHLVAQYLITFLLYSKIKRINSSQLVRFILCDIYPSLKTRIRYTKIIDISDENYIIAKKELDKFLSRV